MRSGMLMLDLNGDGKLEIITASMNGHLTVFHGSSYDVILDKNLAEYLPGYSQTRMQSTLAAADLDNDGRTEIVVATGGADPISEEGPGALLVFTVVGGTDLFRLMPGWPVFAGDALGSTSARPDGHPDGFYSTPALGDIDGDGDMEIVIGGMDRRFHALHHDGSYVLGWPMGRERNIWRESRSSAALVDINDDGSLDILIGSNNYGLPSCANPYHFYAFKGDATLLPGFPFSTTQNIESSPAIGDIDGDGSPDIIFGTGEFNENCGQASDGKKVYALDRHGNELQGWPVTTNGDMPNSPALGDLDNDGLPEVVINSHDTLYAWHGDGRMVQGFPVQGEFHFRHSTAVIADVDGDAHVEIILASGQVFSHDGQLQIKRNKLQSQIVVIDQDGDGLLETIGFNHYNYDKDWHLQGYVFQESGSASGAQPWPMYHRTWDRQGVLPQLFSLSGRIVSESNQGVADVLVTLNSGQSALTDSNGNYAFGNLPPGNYTATPAYQDNIFEPEKQQIELLANGTLPAMTMKSAAYDITGKVMHANGSALPKVTLQLDSSAKATTDKEGIFIFANQLPGTYTLTPVSPDFIYLPGERTVTAQEKALHSFYALPKPVTGSLLPTGSTLELIDTQNLPTRVVFPQGLVEQQATVTPLIAPDPAGYLSAGHTIDIAPSGNNVTTQSNIVGQDGEPLAIVVEIQYSTADLQSLIDAEELVLLQLTPDGWQDAQSTCPTDSAIDHNLRRQTISVPVCQWGTYGLFGPVNRLFMPNLGKNDQ
jgi:hypothetical protein